MQKINFPTGSQFTWVAISDYNDMLSGDIEKVDQEVQYICHNIIGDKKVDKLEELYYNRFFRQTQKMQLKEALCSVYGREYIEKIVFGE